ncbi:Polymerase/histidinol phosphatase-like protein [Radiomyces spectabilis]|uniref:Polymerase/histidinol phosphatase-like protein n=1 Tax=Radiomyces spectabilis TaxID=64574 RepID=UPI00221E5C6F|nr:Polymerase/histidinol phosphatase-like protein [Radiomyces spectabilis]KAI8371407.1 Polymerase/histidinol phosphatase-like protein [Radiomyces spectabilis]
MPYSYHSHSGQFCHHGYGQLEDVVKEAVRKGFKVYGLSEHMPRYQDQELYPEEIQAHCTPTTLQTIFADFYQEARRLQELYSPQIQLLVGTEIEYVTEHYGGYIAQLRQRHPVDYLVGSLHHVGGTPVDFSQELYDQALAKHDGSLVNLYCAFFDEQLAMMQTVKPHVVGHFDLVRIFADRVAADSVLHNEAVKQRWMRNVDAFIEMGSLFEINSRAWKKGLRDAYPHRDIIQYILQKNGKFVLSDDCHGPQDVGMHYDKLPGYLKECGISTIHYLVKENNQIVVREHANILDDAFWDTMKSW